jgi:hypothetical protein
VVVTPVEQLMDVGLLTVPMVVVVLPTMQGQINPMLEEIMQEMVM